MAKYENTSFDKSRMKAYKEKNEDTKSNGLNTISTIDPLDFLDQYHDEAFELSLKKKKNRYYVFAECILNAREFTTKDIKHLAKSINISADTFRGYIGFLISNGYVSKNNAKLTGYKHAYKYTINFIEPISKLKENFVYILKNKIRINPRLRRKLTQNIKRKFTNTKTVKLKAKEITNDLKHYTETETWHIIEIIGTNAKYKIKSKTNLFVETIKI